MYFFILVDIGLMISPTTTSTHFHKLQTSKNKQKTWKIVSTTGVYRPVPWNYKENGIWLDIEVILINSALVQLVKLFTYIHYPSLSLQLDLQPVHMIITYFGIKMSVL